MSSSSQYNFSDVEATVRNLLENQLTESADKLCSLLLSSSSSSSSSSAHQRSFSPQDYTRMLELHGDCVFANKEYRRALHLYRQASQPLSSCTEESSESTNSTGHRGGIATASQAKLRWKECQCHIQLDDATIALRELESIPLELRDVQINVCLGKLYKNAGLRRHAVTTLKLVLNSCPLAIECIEMLASLGVKESELVSHAEPALLGGVQFLPELTKSICNFTKTTKDALNTPGLLSDLFPDSSYALTQLATSYYYNDNIEESIEYFKRIRRVDKYSVEGMDLFAKELFVQGDFLELSKLATDMLHGHPQKSVGWIAAAMYTELKGEKDKSMTFLDKACKVDPRSSSSFTTKGAFFLLRGKPEQASISFAQSNAIQNNVDAYAGLVEANLQLGKYSEALAAAKSALKINPSSSQCFALLGNVIIKSNNANSRKEAKLVFKKALKLDPKNTMASLALSDVYCKENDHSSALTCLKEALEVKPTYEIRCQYGKVLGQLGRYDEAIQHLHFAMSVAPSPDVSDALKEMEYLEQSLKGEVHDNQNDDNNEELCAEMGFFHTEGVRGADSPDVMDLDYSHRMLIPDS